MTKPETQKLGVEGISGTRFGNKKRRNWSELAGLPPFQMFMGERSESIGPYIGNWSHEESGVVGVDPNLIEEYCAWHKNKGYWPNETPFGELEGE